MNCVSNDTGDAPVFVEGQFLENPVVLGRKSDICSNCGHGDMVLWYHVDVNTEGLNSWEDWWVKLWSVRTRQESQAGLWPDRLHIR